LYFNGAKSHIGGAGTVFKFFPHLSQELALKLEYFTFYLSLPFFGLYLYYLFPQEIWKKGALSYLFIGGAYSLHVLLTPSRVYSNYLIYFQVITIGFLSYFLFSIIKAITNFSGTDQLIPLEKELDLVKSYLAIEKARFNERLSVIYNIEEGINIEIPPLILQPIVENAVKHGIQPRRKGGTIEISIRKVDPDVIMEISDDGVGMTREEVDTILGGVKKETGIGLQNVNKRLINYYGHGLIITSEADRGTTVTMRIP
jgi:signal transduction histidine kinase